MTKRQCRYWCLGPVVLFICSLACAEDIKEVWRADFLDGSLEGANKPVFINATSREEEPDRLIFRSEQGVITLGGKFDVMADWAELTWPNLGELSLKDCPMLEIRHRITGPEPDPVFHVEVLPLYLSADGSQADITYYLSPPPKQWQTSVQRLVGDEQIPAKWRPHALVGLSIKVHCKYPSSMEIDWIRLRGLNAAEQRREEQWLELTSDGPPAEPAVLQEFFPFGMYDDSSDTGAHHITHRHAFDVMARHHLNYKQAGFLHVHDGSLTLGPTPKAAEQTGMRMSARIRPILHRFANGGTDAARAYVKPWVDIIADHPAVIGYDIGDERPILDFWAAAGSARILEQLDRRRFSSLTFAHYAVANIATYKSYLGLYLSDNYPLGYGFGPDYLYEWCYKVARESENKRHWIVLQTFGDSRTRRWRSGAILPNVAQLRLMTYGSIAGGARGIIYYTFNGDLFEALLDQWCNPLNDLLDEVSRLGELLIPIGRCMLDAEVDFDTVVEHDNKDHMIVGVLHAPDRGVNYLVVVNRNVESAESTSIELPAAWQDRKVLDLTSLKVTSGQLQVSLSPGNGHIYMIGSAEQCRVEAGAIGVNRIEESLRVMTADISTADSWGLNVSQVLDLQQVAQKVVQHGGRLDLDEQNRLDIGERHVHKAGELLETLLAGHEPYAGIRSQLDQIGRSMGEVEPVMYDDHRDAQIVQIMGPWRDPYWKLHSRWAQAYGMLLKGESEGLSSLVQAIAMGSESLLADVLKTLGSRSMYPD